ncbi:hypothetical protein CDL12_10145 [Handroanthus impetiginosus]|uniref:DUF7054 domain-containing protein n=1 Tax=Handroanthus impetiginosus TaxID=429701 RepID=A0A2G9HI66_9LAMI|nr:hypothetical protein CDL12_24639 [Handroanthus impetiginosus]PIN17195.1 hypothetical protein CDL12_10145 [Handroanthus impetiginosus]
MDSLSPTERQNYGGGGSGGGGGEEKRRQLAKVLVKVNIQNSLGPVQVVTPPETTVGELMKAAIGIYVKEKRRPLLSSSDPQCYELHYSQFSLESLQPEEKLMNLGSRNFFLCPKPGYAVNSSYSTTEARLVAKPPDTITKFIHFLLL